MAVEQRKVMKNARSIVTPLYTHREIKKMLREAQQNS